MQTYEYNGDSMNSSKSLSCSAKSLYNESLLSSNFLCNVFSEEFNKFFKKKLSSIVSFRMSSELFYGYTAKMFSAIKILIMPKNGAHCIFPIFSINFWFTFKNPLK